MDPEGNTQAVDAADSPKAADDQPTDSVADVMDQLEQPQAAGNEAEGEEDVESRHYERHAWSASLLVTVIEHSGGTSRERDIHVITHDVSRGGFSFVAPGYIHPGTVIRARFKALKGEPVLTAVVRSCVHAPGGKCRVGVEFENGGRGKQT